MKIYEIIKSIEGFAPLCYQEGFDNSGLNIGNYEAECTGCLLCFDVTEIILDEAVQKSCNFIISHHPVTISGLKTFRGESLAERIVAKAFQSGISIYACHTPLDSTAHGINAYLGELFNLQQVECLQPIAATQCISASEVCKPGLGVVGYLSEPCRFEQWIQILKNKLHPTVIRHSQFDIITSALNVHRVAFCGGSGGSLISAAKNAKADVYVSGDFKYHDFVESHNGMILMDLGHFETEHFGIQILYDVLRKKIPTFAGSISENIINPIHYIV